MGAGESTAKRGWTSGCNAFSGCRANAQGYQDIAASSLPPQPEYMNLHRYEWGNAITHYDRLLRYRGAVKYKTSWRRCDRAVAAFALGTVIGLASAHLLQDFVTGSSVHHQSRRQYQASLENSEEK